MKTKTSEEKELKEEKSEKKELTPVRASMGTGIGFEDEGSDEKYEEEKEELLDVDFLAHERRATEQSLKPTQEQWEGRLEIKRRQLKSTRRDFRVKGRLLIYDSKDNILENKNGKVSIDEEKFVCRHWALLRLIRNRDYRDFLTQPQSFEDDMREILRLEREGKLYDADQYHIVDINNFGHALAQRCRNLALGDEEHIQFCSGNHMMSILIKHKVDKTPGEYKGIALEFYDPNETFKHMRVLAPDADALEVFELRDWLSVDAINNYFPLQRKAGLFCVSFKSSETITEKVIVDDSLEIDDIFLIAAWLLSEEAFLALVNKVDEEALNQALVMPDEDDWTALHMAACYQSAEAFMALILNVSQEALSAALVLPNSDGWTALHMAAKHQSKEAFMALILNVSQEALSAALVLPNSDGWTALDVVARYQSAEAFMALVNKVSEEALKEALVLPKKDGWTALHCAARYQSAEAFMALVKKVDKAELSQALSIQNKYGSTALHSAAQCQSDKAFMALVGKVSVEALSDTLVLPKKDGWTALHIAAHYQSEEAFMALVNKADVEALNQALVTQVSGVVVEALNQALVFKIAVGDTALHFAAQCQSDKAFMALVGKVSVEALSDALVLPDKNGWTALHIAVEEKKSSVVLALIEKIDIETLNDVLLLVPEDSSTSEKRDYFLDTINLALDQIQDSGTLLNTKYKKYLLNKLQECVALRRGKLRFGLFGDGRNFNRKLDELITTINKLLARCGGENDLFGDGMGLTNLPSPPIRLFGEKEVSDDEEEFETQEEKRDTESEPDETSPVKLGIFEKKGGSEDENSRLDPYEVKGEAGEGGKPVQSWSSGL